MERDEQVGARLPGDPHPRLERQEHVLVARQHHLVAPSPLQPRLERLGGGQGHRPFPGVNADRAGVLAAVPGVDDHHLLAAGRDLGRGDQHR